MLSKLRNRDAVMVGRYKRHRSGKAIETWNIPLAFKIKRDTNYKPRSHGIQGGGEGVDVFVCISRVC